MSRLFYSAVVPFVLAACGGETADESSAAPAEKSGPNTSAVTLDACTLLTAAEVEAAAGWRPDDSKPETHGGTATCTHTRIEGLRARTVAVAVGPSTRSLASSSEMAQWRTEQLQRHPDIKLTVAAVEGLGVPAVSLQTEGAETITLETAAKGRLLSVTTPDLEVSKTLATKAIARLP